MPERMPTSSRPSHALSHVLGQRGLLGLAAFAGLSGLVLPQQLSAADEGHDYGIRLRAGIWGSMLGGDVSLDSAQQGEGTELSLSDDLGLDELTPAPMAELSARLPLGLDLHLGGMAWGLEGEERLERSATFGDQSYSAGTEVSTDAAIVDVYGEAAYRIGLPQLSFSAGLGLHLVQSEVSVDSQEGSASIDESIPVPVLALRASGSLPALPISAELRLHAMAVDLDGVKASWIDAMASLSYQPMDWVGIEAGYRLLDIDIEVDSDEVDATQLALQLQGPYLGLQLLY